jgi:hypothetical protein
MSLSLIILFSIKLLFVFYIENTLFMIGDVNYI